MYQLRVFLLMAGMTALFTLLGGYFGGQAGAIFFFVFAALMNFGMFWFSDRAVLKMYKARIIAPEDAPQLYQMVDRLRQEAGLPMPTVAIAPQQQPNAFATGRSQSKAVVCFTQGLLQLVTPEELEGVTAHELAHIKHHHMLVSTMAATMAGAIGILASIARWGVILGGGRDDDSNPFALLAMAIFAPIAAVVVQLMISRQNEFMADRTAAEITRNPGGLASALQRLDAAAHQIPMQVSPAAAQLAIVNPLASGRAPGFSKLFRTHPSTEERVQKLEQLGLERGLTR